MNKIIFFSIGISLLLSAAVAPAADVWPLAVWATQNNGATWPSTNEFTEGCCNSSCDPNCTMFTVDDIRFPELSIDGICVQFASDPDRVGQFTALRFWMSDINGWDPSWWSWDYFQFVPLNSWLICESDELSDNYIGRGGSNCPPEAQQNNKIMRIDYTDENGVAKKVIIRGRGGWWCGT